MAGIPHVVIVGGGFGGIQAAKGLRAAAVRITLIDRANHFLFQPLLYQVATAGLSPADIATPIRRIFRKQANVEVLLANVTGLDLSSKKVIVDRGDIEYDFLIVATGATHSYYGHDDWAGDAPGLKTLDDATGIRRRILMAFERAERSALEEQRVAEMTFLIIGGGPTGVEMAGSLAELTRHTLVRDFRRIRPQDARVILVEAGDRVLPTYDAKLSERALASLRKLGVEVWLNSRAEGVDERGVLVSRQGKDLDAGQPERVQSRTVIWAAGATAGKLAEWLGCPADRAGRVEVLPDCSVPNHPQVFVIGDAMTLRSERGEPLPGVAQVAMQQGRYVASVILARVQGRPSPPPFRYKDLGNMATIGRSSAIFERGRLKLSGFLAWMGWLFVHLMQLVTFRNRLIVFFQWMWAYLFWERGARLITPVRERDGRLKGESASERK